jgi:4-alpha-glucanotransferase
LQGVKPVPSARRSGLLIPLFSAPSSASWGIGEIGDIAPLADWLSGAGQGVLQLLPLNEMARGQHSPYSAMSALALDPIFIQLSDVPDFTALGGEAHLAPADRDALAAARQSPHVDYATVRRLKRAALDAAFSHFCEEEWRRATPRADAFRSFVTAEESWLKDYALFHALQDREGGQPWPEWPAAVRDRHPSALAEARRDLGSRVLFYQYVQWIADEQWQKARAHAHAAGVALFGDLPFMVDGNSADVWVHQDGFRLDVSVGVPPDAFSATGQDWGMPLYNWTEMTARNFPWLRERARRSAALFDGYRVDHLVGFYRTYGRPLDGGPAFFSPPDEAAQLALGERVLAIMREPGVEIIAEDLGIVPDFVRESLARLRVPGFRVHRWEREWNAPGQPFRDPHAYPALSVATSGTHDTEPMAVWWDNAPPADKRQIDPGIAERGFDAAVRDRLLEMLFASGSDLLLLPIADVFGWRDRINEPAVVNEINWTYRLPWPCDRLDEAPEARERQGRLREWSEKYRRAAGVTPPEAAP